MKGRPRVRIDSSSTYLVVCDHCGTVTGPYPTHEEAMHTKKRHTYQHHIEDNSTHARKGNCS